MQARYLIALCITHITLPEYPKYMLINQPVVDLRTEPIAISEHVTLPTSDIINPLQETQLLFCERIIAHHEMIDKNGIAWIFVEALQQPSFKTKGRWHNYPGWIKKSQAIGTPYFKPYTIVIKNQHAPLYNLKRQIIAQLSIGTKLCGTRISNERWATTLPNGTIGIIADTDVYQISKTVIETPETIRQNIIKTALQFLGSWYSWGGRSAQTDKYISSVDCSALVNLSFAANGLQIPRMSHEQFLMSRQLKSCKDLQPGDFIYFVSITREAYRMDHVMIFLGDDQILESTHADDQKVRIISFQERMGHRCNEIQSGDLMNVDNYEFYVYFGSLLDDQKMLQHWRDEMLKCEY